MQKNCYGWIIMRICIKNAGFKMPPLCFSCFNSLFASHVFKIVLPAHTGSTILQNDFKQIRSFFHFFHPQTASTRAFFVILFALIALLAVPIAIVSPLKPIRFLQTAHDLCTFSLLGPVSKNDRMHHTYIFVNFVDIDASLHQTS